MSTTTHPKHKPGAEPGSRREHPLGAAVATSGSLFTGPEGSVLGLQRLAGNGAVVGALAAQRKAASKAPASDSAPSGPAQGMGSKAGLSLAFFFTGNDSYGQAAQEYVKRYYPEHKRFAATSFEQMFALLGQEAAAAQKRAGRRPIHIDEVVIVTHANAGGGMKIPLTADDLSKTNMFTPERVAELQTKVRKGTHKRFAKTRSQALGGIDRDTRIVVRGCELGKGGEEPLDALAAMFGGRVEVYAPTAFQVFQVEGIGKGWRFKTPVEAFDWLVQAGYIDASMANLTEKAKAEHIKTVFHNKIPSDAYIVGNDDHDELDRLKKKGPRAAMSVDAEKIKHRDKESPTDVTHSKTTGQDAMWATHTRKGARLEKLKGLPEDQLAQLNLPRHKLVEAAKLVWAAYDPKRAGEYLRLFEQWSLGGAAGHTTVAVKESDADDPSASAVERTPDVFHEENVWRAKRDLVDFPDPYQDSFVTEDLKYAKAATAANDFSRSERGGLVDPKVMAGPARKTLEPLTPDSATMFLLGFAEWTGPTVFTGGKLPGATQTGDPTLDRALTELGFVVQMLRAGINLEELKETQARWKALGPTITRVTDWAVAKGFDNPDVAPGHRRVEDRIDKYEVTLRSRRSEAKIDLPRPDAGLWAAQIKDLEASFAAHKKMLEQVTKLDAWTVRHAIRGGTFPSADRSLDGQVRGLNVVRTTVGLIAVFDEFSTLDERLNEARKRGLIASAATTSKMISHALSVTGESTNVIVGAMRRHAEAVSRAYLKARDMTGNIAESKSWWARAEKLRALEGRINTAAGIVAVVSGVLDLIDALETGDKAGARAAAHSIGQGVITTGGGLLKASGSTTAMLSASLVAAWGVMEALALASDNIKGFKRLQKLDKIKEFLETAATLVPWGKRMAAVGDAWEKLEDEDPDRAFALRNDFLARARDPYKMVVTRMIPIGGVLSGAEFHAEMKGPKEQNALKQLEQYRFRDSGEFGPGDIRTITEICVVLWSAMQRIGARAVREYGPMLRQS